MSRGEREGDQSLLLSIEKFSRVKLKKTETKDKSGPFIPMDRPVQLAVGRREREREREREKEREREELRRERE